MTKIQFDVKLVSNKITHAQTLFHEQNWTQDGQNKRMVTKLCLVCQLRQKLRRGKNKQEKKGKQEIFWRQVIHRRPPTPKKNSSYLFRRERRSVPKWAKPAKNGPRVSSWSSEVERACCSLVLSSSEILDVSSRARGRFQPAREREGSSACRETLTVYLKLSERGRVTFSHRQTQRFRRSALSK